MVTYGSGDASCFAVYDVAWSYSPQAWPPLSDSTTRTPSAHGRPTSRCVAAFSNIWPFIVGATFGGPFTARQSIGSRSSANLFTTFRGSFGGESTIEI